MGFQSLRITRVARACHRRSRASSQMPQPPAAAALADGRWRQRLNGLLHGIRWPSALLGMAWWAAWLPVWAQASSGTIPTEAAPVVEAIKQQAPKAVAAVVSNTAAPTGQAVRQGAGSRLMDSYELCRIGRMGQDELAFLTVFILIGCFIFFLQIDRRLIKHGWEIRKALSESSELSFVPEGSNSKPLLNQSGDAVSIRVMEIGRAHV